MNTDAVIKQLKKALACKDDKELRLRVEVIVDMMEEVGARSFPQTFPQPASQPTQPLFPERKPFLEANTITGQAGNKVRGAGPISSVGTEQINYSRPKNT